jgi:type I restriction enzyme M protein
MAIKKSELYSSLWQSCDELRGGMDASQYKDYVLVLLFVKYVSDKAQSRKDYLLTVPAGGRFDDMVALKSKDHIGDGMNKIVAKLAEANDLKGVIDVADWNDETKLGKGKDMIDRLSNLVGIFQNPALDFRGNRAEGDDLLGDAYEYLMRHFATESGKSKGQFYTPAEVSRIMARVIGMGGVRDNRQTIHDPTCGSGSLLLKAHDEAKSATGRDLAIYGQEMDVATTALARMNMFLHDCETHDIRQGNTLASPEFVDAKTGQLKTFDFVVANPPFSSKAWSSGVNTGDDPFKRFDLVRAAGWSEKNPVHVVPPEKNGDYAFLLHILACLKSTGKGAVILPHGVLFRGNAEADIRREVIRRGYLAGIIGLPPNLFYGTGIPACILVLDKEGAATRRGIFMIDASHGFIKDGNKNRLREQDIHKIVDTFTRKAELPRYSRMVPLAEISDPKNDYNLNLPRYIDASEPEDLQDIDSHLQGAIPNRDVEELERYWRVFPGVRTALFKRGRRGETSELRVAAAEVKATIFGHGEFTEWAERAQRLFAKWRKKNAAALAGIGKGDNPKALIAELSEDLLGTFENEALIDPYDVYQHLLDYWAATMQDDLYLLVADGWREAAKPRLLVPAERGKKEKGNGKEKSEKKEKPDFSVGKQGFKTELIPPGLLISRYFAGEQAAIDELEAKAAACSQAIEELVEEHGGEEGLLEEAKNDNDKVTRAAVDKRLRAITRDAGAADERKVLETYVARSDEESETNGRIKAAQDALAAKLLAKYAKLTEDEVKTLVVEDKWLAAIAAAVQGEIDRVSQTLATRIRELADRYATPLPELETEVEALAKKVRAHLQKMGFSA